MWDVNQTGARLLADARITPRSKPKGFRALLARLQRKQTLAVQPTCIPAATEQAAQGEGTDKVRLSRPSCRVLM
jgi:hypothetical protein